MEILTVVNTMLGTLGEVPLNSLSDSHAMLGACLGKLNDASRTVQAKNYWFNTERATLQPSNIDGSIYLPNNATRVLAKESYIVQRGNRLFNTYDATFVFTREQVVTLTKQIDFEDLPEVAANYIAARAVLDFQTLFDGDSAKTKILETKVMDARIEFNAEDIRQRKANLLDSNERLAYVKGRTRSARTY